MYAVRRVVAVIGVGLLMACSGDSTGPDEPPFPAIAGTYALTGTFNTVPATVAGTVTFSQASRESSQLTGTSSLTLPGLSTDILTGMFNATVDEEGNVGFNVGNQGTSSSWRFTGQLNGNAITGTHVLGNSTSSFAGTFTAVRQP